MSRFSASCMYLVCFRDDHMLLDNQLRGSSMGKTNFFLCQQSLIAYGSSSSGRALEDFTHPWWYVSQCYCSGFVQATILLRFQRCGFPALYKTHSLSKNILILWLFCLLFVHRCKGCALDISLELGTQQSVDLCILISCDVL